MNLFISDNFIDTVGQKVNVLQVIRQVAEDDDLLHGEVMAELRDLLDYVSTDVLEDAINADELEDLALHDAVLYVGGQTLKDLFEVLYPNDHTAVIDSLVASIEASTSPTLRLDHNCLPVVPVEHQEVQQTIDFSSLATLEPSLRLSGERTQSIADPVPENHVITAINDQTVTIRAVEPTPFQGDSEETEVLRPEVAVLNSEAVMGELKVNNSTIPVAVRTGKNGVLFDVVALYYAAYGLMLNHEYLTQILIENRLAIHPDDIDLTRGTYMTAGALAVLHGRLCHIIEWEPLVMKVVTSYDLNPHLNLNFDLLGNRVG